MDDAALENLLFSRVGRPKAVRPLPDYAEISRSLKSHKGMSLALEWQRYISANPHGYQYSYLCELFLEWSKHVDFVMRQEHLAGDKAFSDFAGSTLRITNRHTGEVQNAHLFVCCLGASSYTFAKAFSSENSEGKDQNKSLPSSREQFLMASCRDLPESGAATFPEFTADISGIHTDRGVLSNLPSISLLRPIHSIHWKPQLM